MTNPSHIPSDPPPAQDHGASIEAEDLARYIAEMSGEMALLAKRAGWPFVAYFLDMAQLEAQSRLSSPASGALDRGRRAG